MTASELNIFQKKLIRSLAIKLPQKYLQNTCKQLNNVWILYIGFIDFLLKDKYLSDYTNLLSPNKYEKMIK